MSEPPIKPDDALVPPGPPSPLPPPGGEAGAVSRAADAPPVPPVPPRRVTVPADRDRFRLWSSLVIAVVVCLPPLLIALDEPDVTQETEAAVLVRSRETWQRVAAGVPLAWLIPSENGKQSLDPPPMTVWLHLAAWADLDPGAASPGELAFRGRLVTVAMALLTLIATYWAGVSISGVRGARLAAMVLGTTLLFIFESRYAGSEVVLLGWTTLAIAAGLWAMRPLKPLNWVGRRVSGWLFSGLAMGAAILTAGPLAMLFVLPPLIAAILVTKHRRPGNSLGLLFAVILGAVAVSPWYLYVIEQTPDALETLLGKYSAPRDLFLLSWSHGRALIMLSPWQVWLVGALCQPFIRAEHEERRQLLIAWFWFVLLFVILSIPAAKHPRFLVPILPAAALLVGQLWAYHARLASERLEEPGVNLLRVPHWLLITLASIAGPALLALQSYLVRRGTLSEVILPLFTWHVWAGLGAALLLIAALGMRWHFKWRPRPAAYATVAWMVLASTVCLWAFTRTDESTYEPRAVVEDLRRLTQGAEVTYLDIGAADLPPDPVFLFYFGRAVHAVMPQQLDELRQAAGPAFVLARIDDQSRATLAEHGFKPALDLHGGVMPRRRLYRSD